MSDPAAAARAVIDANRYMTLGTADQSGRPWVTPVWFAPADYREFFWVSSPAAVYWAGVALELSGAALERGLEVFARESAAQGLTVWTMANVTAPARHRLYRAAVTEQWVLDPHDERLPVTPV